jgi:short-subunit dehydrogenase
MVGEPAKPAGEERSMSIAQKYGPWAVIAGASEGTGAAFARLLAAEGVPSVLIARREAPLAALADGIRADTGVECVTAAVDLTAPDALDRIIAAVGDREVGLFVANAGADDNGAYFLDAGIAAWTGQIQRNVMIMTQASYHFGSAMRERGKGGLLLVNSGACYGGSSHMAVYTATKAFMLCFAEGLWAELRDKGVDVLTLVLGRTDTAAFRKLLAEKGQPVPEGIATAEAVAEAGLARLPHGPIHNFGSPDDAGGFGYASPDDRRQRVLAIEAASRAVFGK